MIGRMIRLAVAAVAALALLAAGCSTDTDTATAPATTTRATAPTTPDFPEPPPYTHEVDDRVIRVYTASADPTDLLNTYNHLARTQRGSLPEGGYDVQIECSLSDAKVRRLANGTIGVGRLGVAQVGDFGKFGGVVPGAHCP